MNQAIEHRSLDMRIFLFLVIIFTSMNVTCISLDVSSSNLAILMEDMKKYKQVTRPPGPLYSHAGDLYEHSLWVEQVIAEWSDQSSKNSESFWCEGLTERELSLMALAGFLHDVGKGGDCCYKGYESKKDQHDELIVEYECNREHPRIGFEYLYYDGQKTREQKSIYKLFNSEYIFDFNKLFDEFKVTQEEQVIIAILVGIHWHFGTYVVSEWESHDHAQLAQRYLESLDVLVKEAHYNQGRINESLLRMSILINAADVKGSRPSTGTKTHLFKEVIKKDATHEILYDGYNKFGFQAYGHQAHDYVIQYFKDHWDHNNAN